MAKPYELNLIDLVNNNKEQFVIPIYQRGYNWKTENVEKLINDIIEFATNNIENVDSQYFVGNIITKELPKKSLDQMINKFIIVDGQQRITTTLLIALAIYNSDIDLFDDLKSTFILKEKHEDKLKIDRLSDTQTLSNLIKNNSSSDDEKTNIYKNYKFIQNKLKNEGTAKNLYNALKRALIMNIKLSENENENKVFETINSSGLLLSEGDLIKNYIFFYAHSFTNEDILIKNFEKNIKSINEKDIDNFYRYFTVIFSENKKLPKKSAKGAIFSKFKDVLEEMKIDNKNQDDVEKFVNGELCQFIEIYKHINEHIFYDKNSDFFISVIRKNINTYFTLVIGMYIEFNKEINEELSKKIVKIVAKIIIFRNINGDPDKNITRDVPFLIKTYSEEVGTRELDDFIKWINNKESGNVVIPSLDQLKATSVNHQIYNNRSQTQNVLKAYELSMFKNSTDVDLNQEFTIEHVMPQKFKINWFPKIDLVDPPEYFNKNQKINTIGNLTLIPKGMNSGLSNDVFEIKKNGKNGTEGLVNDALLINKEFSAYLKWDVSEIDSRTLKIVNSVYKWFM